MGKDAVSCALKISVGALVLALTGCVSLTTGEENVVAELQDFANRTTALYRVPSVRISIQSATNLNTGAVYRQGNVFVNVKMLSSTYVKKLMAHELGHYLLGHDGFIPNAVSQAEWQRGQEQRELDANAKAVEILVRVEGMDERDAVEFVSEYLRRAQWAVDRGAPVARGHLPPAAELADLLSRFPAR